MSTPAAQRQSPKGLAVRERLLQATEKLLAERGYEGATVQLVSAAAQVSRNQFFHHFGSKEALCLAVLERARRSWRNEISGPAAGFTPGSRLGYVTGRLIELQAEDGVKLRLLAALAPAQAALPEGLRLELASLLAELLDFWRTAFKDHRRDKQLSSQLKPRTAARLALAVLLGSATLTAVDEPPDAEALSQLLLGLAGDAQPGRKDVS